MKSSTLWPVVMVIAIVMLIIIVMTTGRSNAPNISGDSAYPHHVCVIDRYCAGGSCTSNDIPFVAYLRHANGRPRLELANFGPNATLTEIPDGIVIESTGGMVSGTVTIFNDQALDLIATSGEGSDLIEHFASGRCDRLISP